MQNDFLKIINNYMFKLNVHLLTCIFLLQVFVINAQTTPRKRCSIDAYQKAQLVKNPDLQIAIDASDKAAQNWSQHKAGKTSKNCNLKTTVTIPVVVHIVYYKDAPDDNLSIEQIESQIRVLNEDYNCLNIDRVNVPPVFEDVKADVDIEFCLATQDPNGAFTDGVTRTETDTIEYSISFDGIKKPERGGAPIWDRDSYLNIWVGRLKNDVLGYAASPNFGASIDGVVIGTRYFGKGNNFNLNPQYNKGRTSTHEVGHWLGLKHTWGNISDEELCEGDDTQNSCTSDDGIEDTPNSSCPYYGCPIFSESISCGTQDMTMNFMDYVNDACMYMFTKGQKDRILSVLNTTRKDLFDSRGCQSLNLGLDAGVSVNQLETVYCGKDYPLAVNIQNLGVTPITCVDLNYIIDGGTLQPFKKAVDINPGETKEIILAQINVNGQIEMQVWIDKVNDINDENDGNNSIAFSVFTPAYAKIPLTEGMEVSSGFQQDGWRNENPDADDFEWLISGEFGAPPTGSNSLIFNNYSGEDGNNPRNTEDHLITPALDFKNATLITFSFDRAYARYDMNLYDGLRLSYSIDCGNSWTPFWYKENEALATNNLDFEDAYYPINIEDWKKETIDLTEQLSGQSEVLLRITNVSGWGQLLWLDNIKVEAEFDEVGITNINEGTFTLSPNPTTDGLVNIELSKSHPAFELMEIYNTTGQLVSKENIFLKDAIQIDLSQQNNGLYLIILSGDEVRSTNKVLLSK